MELEIRHLSALEFSVNAPILVDIYLAAMNYAPSVHEQRVQGWRHNCLRPGFAAVCATIENQVVGFAYGFTGTADYWWQRQILDGLSSDRPLTSTESEIIENYFEIAEVHVLPGYQGHGIGRKMMCELLSSITEEYAILSTPEVKNEDNFAFHLYHSLGFSDLLRHFKFSGDDRDFAVLYLKLK